MFKNLLHLKYFLASAQGQYDSATITEATSIYNCFDPRATQIHMKIIQIEAAQGTIGADVIIQIREQTIREARELAAELNAQVTRLIQTRGLPMKIKWKGGLIS
jgi:hypothetical protein